MEQENIIGKVNKIRQSSKGMIKFITALESKIIIQGRIHKSFLNAYLKCAGIPIIWKKNITLKWHTMKVMNITDIVV